MRAWAAVVILVVGCGKAEDKAPPVPVNSAPVKVEAPPKTACERAVDHMAELAVEMAKSLGRDVDHAFLLEGRLDLLADCRYEDWPPEVIACIEQRTLETMSDIDQACGLDPRDGAEATRVETARDWQDRNEQGGGDSMIRAMGPGRRTFRIIGEHCSELAVAAVVKAAVELRAAGFTRVECFDGARVVAAADL